MSQVAIEKVDEKRIPMSPILNEMRSVSDRIRQHAFELFERRGSSHGMAINDWLDAERDLFRIPESELIDRDSRFEANVSAPGFDPAEVHVTALPDALIVRGRSTHKHDQTDCNVRFCEFDQKTLFRRFDLPETINVDKVTADLDKGVLHVTAFKSKPETMPAQPPKQPNVQGHQPRPA